jgi:hypothetical protein
MLFKEMESDGAWRLRAKRYKRIRIRWRKPFLYRILPFGQTKYSIRTRNTPAIIPCFGNVATGYAHPCEIRA